MRGSSLLGVSLLAGVLFACKPSGPEQPWKPGMVYATPRDMSARGLLDRRGLIHAHSVYSHDACDDEPVKNGVRDPVCFDDFRRGLCQVQHDFVMLTDHRDAFTQTEFPDSLLYRADRGDQLVERNGKPVASFAACPDGSRALIMAGAEAGTMPVGLEGHVDGDRGDIYGRQDDEAIAALKAQGAVVLMAHTEAWKADQLAELPLDGFEMYNLHANSFASAGVLLELLLLNSEDPSQLPEPDLIVLPMWTEAPAYTTTWGRILSKGLKRVTTMGTDCHRNSFPALLKDGERGDSYRRMMIWFSNHLLIRPNADGAWDDLQLKEALKGGRLYGAFEIVGYPVGFDSYAEVGDRVAEMGEEISAAERPTLVVKKPAIQDLDPEAKAPELTLRILRATAEGWVEVAATRDPEAEELRAEVTEPGAYRAEVRMVPHHLSGQLGKYGPEVLARDLVWIYANPIYVR
ncbi:MAG: hypothetical protein IT384_09125 [Deltaproteobacteria bacterium]|nr:hypothetical protein [Deltaproteobacteria bacterium]